MDLGNELSQKYEDFRPTTIGEVWSRQKAIDEVLNWIKENSKPDSTPSCEEIVEYLQEM